MMMMMFSSVVVWHMELLSNVVGANESKVVCRDVAWRVVLSPMYAMCVSRIKNSHRRDLAYLTSCTQSIDDFWPWPTRATISRPYAFFLIWLPDRQGPFFLLVKMKIYRDGDLNVRLCSFVFRLACNICFYFFLLKSPPPPPTKQEKT